MLERRNWNYLEKARKTRLLFIKSLQNNNLIKLSGKIAEKIMATRLSHISQVTDLLDIDQMGGRKKRSVIDAVMTLTHNIELAKNQGNTLSCLMLDVKGAFDHISIYQLLATMKKL